MDEESKKISEEVREISFAFEEQIRSLCEKYKHRGLFFHGIYSKEINTVRPIISLNSIPCELKES